MKDRTIAGKLLFAQNALENAKTITSELAAFGYDEAKLQEGEALLTQASDLHNKQMTEYGEQFAATDELNLARANANKSYSTHLKIARIALRDNKTAEASLQLSGKRKESFSGWLSQAKAFYSNVHSGDGTLPAMAQFGIDQAKLESAQAEILALEAKLSAQLKEKGEAQAATQERDAALDELQDWISDFVAIARIALEDQPQYLEMLGIVEPS